jgi:hypothetical protein
MLGMLMTSRRLLGSVLLATVALIGCSDDDDDDGGTTPTNVTGTYNLTLVNGAAPPGTTSFPAGGGRIEITSATMVLRENQTYTETINARTVPASGTATTSTQTENGSYAIYGNTIVFTLPATTSTPAFSYDGTITGNTLTYVFAGTAITYTKQ